MPKPSPLASIFMFIGAALLLWAIFSASWFSHSFGDGDSMSVGIVRAKFCYDGECKSQSVFSGSLRGEGMLAILTFLLSFAGIVLAVIAGIFLLKPGRSTLAVIALAMTGGAALFALIVIVLIKARGISYGVPVFFLGVGGIVTGSIMAMSRPGLPGLGMPMGMRPGMPYGPPMGMPMNPYGAPLANPYAPPHANPYAPPGAPAPRANPYAPPGMAPPAAPQAPAVSPYAPPQPGASAGAASASSTQGAPCQTCQTPTTWVAQYNRWFCARCQKYA